MALIAPLLPARRRVGRPRTSDLRDVFHPILYIATTGCQWGMLPNDFPPVSKVLRYSNAWRNNGLLDEMNRHVVAAVRQADGRPVRDRQPERENNKKNGDVRGHDAGKRINGRKRQIVTDTIGLPVGTAVHGADIQDRDGAPELLKSVSTTYPLLHHLFADGGYAGPKLNGALEKIGRWTLQIVKRSDLREESRSSRADGWSSALPRTVLPDG